PSTTICRSSTGTCDVAETCTGSGAGCPADTGLPDGDGDGVCDAIDDCPAVADPSQADDDNDGLGHLCDPCTLGVAVTKPVLRITKYTTGAGDDRLTLVGKLDFATAPTLDPVTKGARVLLVDANGDGIFDVTIPPGAYDRGTKTGWKSNLAG